MSQISQKWSSTSKTQRTRTMTENLIAFLTFDLIDDDRYLLTFGTTATANG